MKTFALTNKEKKKHTINWIIIISLITIVDPIPGNIIVNIIGGAFEFGNYIFLYYALSLFFFQKLNDKKLLVAFTYLIIIFSLFFIGKYLRSTYVVPKLGGEASLYGASLIRFLIDSVFQLFVIGSCAYVFYLNKLTIHKLNLQKEKEKTLLNNELNFLKGQFNTHLTFNFLNFCYSHLNKYSCKASDAIEDFSNMLEHSLKTKLNEYIPLEKEIEYIKSFISLQKTISTETYITFNSDIQVENKYILPKILVSIIENAFSHGKVNQKETPIKINLIATNDALKFSVLNKISDIPKVSLTDLGENNLRQILQIYHNEKHHINIKQYNGINSIELKIFW